jgi:hypothetical protein
MSSRVSTLPTTQKSRSVFDIAVGSHRRKSPCSMKNSMSLLVYSANERTEMKDDLKLLGDFGYA